MKTIYLVDDDELMLTVLTRALEREQYRVRPFLSAVEAASELENDTPDLVISDINMPHMDGFELAELVAGRPQVTPLVLITGQPTDEYAARSRALGIRRLVKKPIGNLSSLIDVVEEVLPRSTEAHVDGLRREFFVGLSHELRTPLTALKLALDELAAGVDATDNGDRGRLIEIGQRNADRLAQYVDRQLMILEMTSAGGDVVRRDISLADAIGEAADPCPSLNGTGEVLVLTDPARLQAVIRYLVGNPGKEGDSVRVEARLDEKGDEVVLEVENATLMDSCAGEAALPLPWNPSTKGSWRSFGERACQRIIESIGGKLIVGSNGGICIRLPLSAGGQRTRKAN